MATLAAMMLWISEVGERAGAKALRPLRLAGGPLRSRLHKSGEAKLTRSS